MYVIHNELVDALITIKFRFEVHIYNIIGTRIIALGKTIAKI